MQINPLNISEILNDDRQLRSLIGLGRDDFEKLSNEFSSCIKQNQLETRRKKTKKPRQRKIGGGRKSALGLPENQLVFILFYLKNYPTYDVLAFGFNISRGCAFSSVKRLLPILIQTQKNLKVLPKRTTDDPQILLQLIESVDRILIDATERPVQRPPKKLNNKSIIVEKKAFIPSRIRWSPILVNGS